LFHLSSSKQINSHKGGPWPLLAPPKSAPAYALCGASGICDINNSPVCGCLRGFEPKRANSSNTTDWSDVLLCRRNGRQAPNEFRPEELPLFDLATLTSATNNFSTTNKLGRGGFGPVYKRTLEDGQQIAVKRLSKDSRQGLDEFANEVVHIVKLQHRNLVKLLGCCIESDEKMLVYEFMPNKSFGLPPFRIINGIARGLLYLHQDSRLRIVHRDLKASNVLLDYEMNPKISDFGLARSFGGNITEANTNKVAGTYFGVLVLETINGKSNRGFSHPGHQLNLLGHAWRLFREDKAMELVAESIIESCKISEIHCLTLNNQAFSPKGIFDFVFIENEIDFIYRLFNKSTRTRVIMTLEGDLEWLSWTSVIYHLVNQTSRTRLIINQQGDVERLLWIERTNSWLLYNKVNEDHCETYELCGAFGICDINNSPMCGCLRGFEPKTTKSSNMANWLDGCRRDGRHAPNEFRVRPEELPLFDLATLTSATNNFSRTNKLGQGGFGPVYKGTLEDGKQIAVKRLSKDSRQGLDELENEVVHIVKLQQRNLVKLLGCCIESDEKMLIYEFMPNKSLDYHLLDETQSQQLDWPMSYSIINGIARGLLYLHQDSRLRIVHRDLKASNILALQEASAGILRKQIQIRWAEHS
ncbi:hypothetical protein Tsubulata_025653, partial [Turnera subulata]